MYQPYKAADPVTILSVPVDPFRQLREEGGERTLPQGKL